MGDFLKNPSQYIKDGVKDGIHESLVSAGTWVVNFVIGQSYWICLTVALIALFLYIGGKKEAGKYISLSFLVFFILQCLKAVLGI